MGRPICRVVGDHVSGGSKPPTNNYSKHLPWHLDLSIYQSLEIALPEKISMLRTNTQDLMCLACG